MSTDDTEQSVDYDSGADDAEIDGVATDIVPSDIIDNEIDIQTGVDETDDGDVRVHRTAAFAEIADRPKQKAIDEESMKNDVKFFDDLRKFDAELAGTIYAQCQSAGSGADVTHPKVDALDDDRSDLEKTITQECRQLLRDLGIQQDIMTFFRNLVVHGNDVSWIEWMVGSGEDDGGVTDLLCMPLRALTILDVDPRTNQNITTYGGTDDDYERSITDAEYYVINEGDTDIQDVTHESEVLHIALNRRGHWHKDHKGRWTYGVWGERRLEPVRYTLQAKQNTLANKVAMDDKLLAREFYYINVEELFGHIEDPDRRQEKTEEYAGELRRLIEDLEADQKPILPEEVEVEIEGPDGDTARKMSDFIQTMNDSLQHALTYHVASFGRDAGGTGRGNRPAKDMSDNSVRQLREVVKDSFRRLFEIHAVLRHEEIRQINPEYSEDDIRRYELDPEADVEMPILTFDPVDPSEQVERVRNAISMYEKGIADLNEARVEANLEPIDDSDAEDMMWFRNPTLWSDDDEEDVLYKNQQLPTTPSAQMEMQEQEQENEDGPDGEERNPDTEGPGDEDQQDQSPSDDDDDGDDGDSGGNRRTYPTDSVESYSTDPDDWDDPEDAPDPEGSTDV